MLRCTKPYALVYLLVIQVAGVDGQLHRVAATADEDIQILDTSSSLDIEQAREALFTHAVNIATQRRQDCLQSPKTAAPVCRRYGRSSHSTRMHPEEI